MEETPSPQPKRRPRGGMFSDMLTRGELQRLKELRRSPATLAGEIDLLRVGVRRMTLALNDTPEPSLEDYRLYLSALGQACTRVARLIEAQDALEGGDALLQDALSLTLRRLLATWDLGGRQVGE